jgi:hypothetical protein
MYKNNININPYTILNNNDSKILQPETINIELFQHQKTMIYKLIENIDELFYNDIVILIKKIHKNKNNSINKKLYIKGEIIDYDDNNITLNIGENILNDFQREVKLLSPNPVYASVVGIVEPTISFSFSKIILAIFLKSTPSIRFSANI